MDNLLQKTLSPKASESYNLLLRHPGLSAKDISKKMAIVVNSVYRNLRELIKLGLIEEVGGYPLKYRPKPVSEAVALYTRLIRQNFYESFGLGGQAEGSLKIKFFQSRKDFLRLVEKDFNRAKKYINVIISGHEVPADFVLSHKKAVDRGAKIRKLIQHLNVESIQVAKNYQKIGVETRHTPLMNMRIVVIDGQVTYFGSYTPDRQQESIGVRFDYAPYAKLMSELFEQRWSAAKDMV